jgi:DNA polymerase
MMGTREELIDLLGQVKRQLMMRSEIGRDSPFLSPESIEYLNRGLRRERVAESDITFPKNLAELEDFLNSCDRCKLGKGRKNLVFGDGPPDARIVFVGEAPGVEEDATGKPFVGKAGKLLTDIIRAMGLTRSEVYICNVAKCHPPRNRDPEPDEIEACLPFLRAQISLIGPEIICTLGRIPAQSLIDKDFKITKGRGQWYSFMGIPVMPTYHPAYLLRYPQAKRQAWEDIQKIMRELGLKDPRKSGGSDND